MIAFTRVLSDKIYFSIIFDVIVKKNYRREEILEFADEVGVYIKHLKKRMREWD